MLKDPGAAYYVYECSGEPGRVTGVVAICPVNVLAGGNEAAAERSTHCRRARDRRAQGAAASRVARLRGLARHGSHFGAAKEGASLYAVTDPAGITHRVWEVKREDAVGAIRAMLDQAPEPALADDPAYAAALVGASQLGRRRPCRRHLHGQRAVQLCRSCALPRRAGQRRRAAGPTGLLTHQVARF